ncbi:Scr1 family TA system antitoxin-like transcriptional regulator [Spirillospora sp. NPDC000708]
MVPDGRRWWGGATRGGTRGACPHHRSRTPAPPHHPNTPLAVPHQSGRPEDNERIAVGPAKDSPYVKTLVDFRLSRQQVLSQPEPPHYVPIIAEAVLYNQVGGDRAIMRAQLRRLGEAARLFATHEITFELLLSATLSRSASLELIDGAGSQS